jgi:nitrite reductase (NADH) small subunit
VSDWHEVGSAAELVRTGRLLARVGGREIGVVHDPATGRSSALRNRCPHHGAPLCLGTVRARERDAGRPGTYAYDGSRVLHCPWHGWEFDLETGRCRDDPRMRVAVYPVRVEDGRVYVRA